MIGTQLGGFTLERLLGRGGMAEVWLGRHGLSDQPAAVKLITPRNRAHDRWQAALRREVRAVAGLDHPGIVSVLDAGTVPADPQRYSGLAGSPWLAMRAARHGELRRLPTPMSWPLLREVLLQILDALAHAHARDVVHRDLKPENVLLDVEDGRLRLLLTDFGIAHVIEPDGAVDATGSGLSAGTPRYMAPEQLRGEWRDFGPCTDLYALGCMAFELAGGAPPYGGATPMAVAMQHLSGPIPRVAPRTDLPDGVCQWIRRLMARDPAARYACAADAAHVLARLPAPTAAETRAACAAAVDAAGIKGPDVLSTVVGTLATVVFDGPAAPADASPAHDGPAGERPPIPETWYVDLPRPPLLRGLGLGLFGVRGVPFAGRDGARSALWDALRRVERQQKAEMVLIRGPEGIGKTALVRWFIRRARELGAADALQFHFDPTAGRGEGIAAGLAGFFRGQGLDQDALEARIRAALIARDPARAALIEAVVAPSLTRTVVGCVDDVVPSPSERHGAERDLLASLARARSLIVLYDDLHAADEAIDLVDWLLERGLDAPVLLVGTWRSDHRAADPRRRLACERVAKRAQTIDLGPLDRAAHDRVVEELLGLSPDLSDALRAGTGGNPLFTVQTVTEWVESGALQPTSRGYAARPTRPLPMPTRLDELAARRIARVVDVRADAEQARQALEVAAALGERVQRAEWSRACARLSLPVPEGLEAALLDAGLAVADDAGWAFAHDFVRRALVTRTAEARRAAVHRACAEAIGAGHSPERRARHWQVAGEYGRAVDALARAAQAAMDASAYDRALALCDRRVALMDRAGLPADAAQRARCLSLRSNALRFTGRPDDARRVAEALDRFPLAADQHDLRAEQARMRGARAAFMGDVRGYAEGYLEAIALYRTIGDARGEARGLHGLGWSRIIHGRYAEALDVMVQSRAVAEAHDLRVDAGWAWHGETAARFFGELGDIEAPLAATERLFGAIRLPSGVGLARVERAEVQRMAGRYDESRRHAEAAFEIFAANGSHLIFRPYLALTLLDLRAGDALTAHRRVSEMLRAGVVSRVAIQHAVGGHLITAWTALLVGDDDGFATRLAKVEAETVRGFLHPGLRRGLEQMGDMLEARGRPADARRVWQLAADHWRAVDPARSARCAARHAALR